MRDEAADIGSDLAIQNRSLWEVYGSEHVAFDTLHSLPLPAGKSPFLACLNINSSCHETGDMENMDIVESFAIHVPLTNVSLINIE